MLTTDKGLKELAAVSANLKPHTTFLSLEGIEALRKTCGGNGYLLHSAIAQLASNTLWNVTAEGDYRVMQLFAAKYLLQQSQKDKVTDEYVDYLNDLKGVKNIQDLYPVPEGPQSFLDEKYLVKLFRFRVLKSVIELREANKGALGQGMN